MSAICLQDHADQFKAEFQAPIEEAMPQIVALLQHNDGETRCAGANALSKLSEHCEITAICPKGHADINLKLCFMHQLGRQCHRLLLSSRTRVSISKVWVLVHCQNCLNNVRSQQFP